MTFTHNKLEKKIVAKNYSIKKLANIQFFSHKEIDLFKPQQITDRKIITQKKKLERIVNIKNFIFVVWRVASIVAPSIDGDLTSKHSRNSGWLLAICSIH